MRSKKLDCVKTDTDQGETTKNKNQIHWRFTETCSRSLEQSWQSGLLANLASNRWRRALVREINKKLMVILIVLITERQKWWALKQSYQAQASPQWRNMKTHMEFAKK